MLLTTVVFILTLLLLVLSHEFGHFFAAKRFGIKVLEFGFGLPPRIFGKKVGETVYSLNWLPLGGFVRLLGEDEADKKVLEDKRSFAAQKVWQRIVVVVAGVAMNVILSWVMFYIVLGVQNFRIIYPTLEPVVYIDGVEKGSPADLSGIKEGEKIVKIDGKNVGNIEDAVGYIKNRPGQKIELTLSDLNGGKTNIISVTPKKLPSGDTRIGVSFSPVAIKTYKTLPEKALSGVTYTFDLIRLTYAGLGQVINNLSHNQLNQASQYVSGPVGIAVATNNIVSLGKDAVIPYIWFVGVFSLSLAAINVLPFPALDGGRLVFLIIEGVFRKKVSAEVEQWIHTAGMAILLALIVLITFSDIRKLIS